MFGTLEKFKTQHSSSKESRAHGKLKEVLFIFTTLNSKSLVIESQRSVLFITYCSETEVSLHQQGVSHLCVYKQSSRKTETTSSRP